MKFLKDPDAEVRQAAQSTIILTAPLPQLDEFFLDFNEGDGRALFVVVDGEVQLSKLVGGIDTPIGKRKPGTVYGEVPMIFGTQMQATARAIGPSRVLRIDTAQYYILSAASPDFSQAIGALALERLGGLQGITAQAPKPQVTVLGQRWDTGLHDLRRFLQRNRITFEAITLDFLAGALGKAGLPASARR